MATHLADGLTQIQDQRDLVVMHFDQRISLFFAHLITCWQTPYEYHIEEANEQFGQGGNSVKIEGGRSVPCKTRAAHSSTLPGLLFRKRESNDAWAVYLKGSHTSNLHNATIEFHTCLNDADSFIDGTANQKDKLRSQSIALINQVAMGTLKPISAMHRFLRITTHVLQKHIEQLPEGKDKRRVLELYLERAKSIANAITDEGYFDQLLAIKMIGDPDEQRLRQAIYAIRFKLIRDTQLVETKIAQAILETHKKINNRSRTKTLAKINADFRFHLLHKSDPGLQRALQRFLCTSHEQLDPGYDLRNRSAKEAKREAFYETHKDKIQTLFCELHTLFYQIHRAETLSWSASLRSIRNIRNWTQDATAARHREQFPAIPMSRSTYCRLERMALPDTKVNYLTPESQRKKPVSAQRALSLSRIFGTDPGLLLANLSGSLY